MSGLVITGLQVAILHALKNAPDHVLSAHEIDQRLGSRHSAREMFTAIVRLEEAGAILEVGPLLYRLADNPG